MLFSIFFVNLNIIRETYRVSDYRISEFLKTIGGPALPSYRRTVAVAVAPPRPEEAKDGLSPVHEDDQQQDGQQDWLT